MADVKISVLTPVYNRADKIHRVFESLEKSTFKDFELIIVDDGSTDNLDEVVESYKNKVHYPVTYIKKPNGGKHTALNILFEKANGEYIFQLDSDDEIISDAMEKALAIWDKISPEERDKYYCVVGRVIDQHNREIIGDLLPDDINEHDREKTERTARKMKEEKCSLMRTDVLKKYRFPEPEGIKFVTERIVWDRISNDYRSYYTNEKFRVYYINEGECLSNSKKNTQWAKNTYFNRLYILNRNNIHKLFPAERMKYLVHLTICRFLLKKDDRKTFEKIKPLNRISMMLISPVIYLLMPYIKKKINWIGED